MATSSPFFLARTSIFHSIKPFSNITLSPFKTPHFHLRSTRMERSEIKAENQVGEDGKKKKKIFVAGATGKTGKRIVDQLLAKGFSVKAGVRDTDKAKTTFPNQNQDLQFVKADVTEGSDKLAEAIGDDSDAVICATDLPLVAPFLLPPSIPHRCTASSITSSVLVGGRINDRRTASVTSSVIHRVGLGPARSEGSVTSSVIHRVGLGPARIEACRKGGVSKFILVSSILVNGAAMGQLLNPAYIILNVFGFVLVAKLKAEEYIRKSGIDYTIIRPGGLKNDPPKGNIVMEPEDTLSEGSISRDQVAEVAVEALLHQQSSYKVVEIVARTEAPKKTFEELFGSIKER
ncbi:NAD(P)-binding domain-containing protein [Cynara cardunculus var. scolymus]|uniref:NAD(P)-binding domain-containing protein n=1 Tax=Cynara cardunculus var. scolymus TaxID=59895 RepID=A0A103Y1N6_CYNCS|nr:NAD(P)-binding domain-containing protein [Cynara cardunculus var. scolymus]